MPPVVGISPRWVDSILGAWAKILAGFNAIAPKAAAPNPYLAKSRLFSRVVIVFLASQYGIGPCLRVRSTN